MGARAVFINSRETRRFEAGATIFAEGDEGHEMFGVIDGRLDLWQNGRQVGHVDADGTFGELAIIDHVPRSLTAIAAETTNLAVIDEKTFLFLVHETPTFALQVMRSLAARLRELDAT